VPPPGSAGRRPALTSNRGWHHRGYLPHFDQGDCWQAITYRLADSLPVEVLTRLESELAVMPEDLQDSERRKRLEDLLGRAHGACLLRQPAVADIVLANWIHFAGQRYNIGAWVIMPNHVHLLIKIRAGIPLTRIVQSWKSYSAKRIIRLTGCPVPVWQADYWDRFIRDQQHFAQAAAYIENNPVAARLTAKAADWRWSSAWKPVPETPSAEQP
jgi:REP element-mobilizing transposase RayT